MNTYIQTCIHAPNKQRHLCKYALTYMCTQRAKTLKTDSDNNRQIPRQTDRQTDRQEDRKTDRQKQAHIHTQTHTDLYVNGTTDTKDGSQI